MNRSGRVVWETTETKGEIVIHLDDPTLISVTTPYKMLTHLLEQIAKHGRFGLEVKTQGDIRHHIVEDTGIRFGRALSEALGTRAGIFRTWDCTFPLDEARAKVVIDLSTRPYVKFEPDGIEKKLREVMAEDLPLALIFHFYESMGLNGMFNLHMIIEREGRDGHHIAECMTKAFARALHFATREDPTLAGNVASTKGIM